MSDVVHYDAGDLELEDNYKIKTYSACGVLTWIVTPRKPTEVNKATYEKDEVTCENCKRTKEYKND